MSHEMPREGGPGPTPVHGQLLEVSGLQTHFRLGKGWRITQDWVRAVDGVDFTLARGEVLGIVGESGSGKTTVGRSVIRLVRPTAGTVRFDGVDILSLSPKAMRIISKEHTFIKFL